MTAVPSSSIDSSQPIRRQGERKEEQNRLGGAKEIPHNTAAFPSPTVHSFVGFFHSSLHWFIHSFTLTQLQQIWATELALVKAQSGFRTCYASLGGNEYPRARENERRRSQCEASTDSHSIWPIVTHDFSIQDGSFKTQLPQTLQDFSEDEMWLFWRTTKNAWKLPSFFVSLFTAVGYSSETNNNQESVNEGNLMMVCWYDFNDSRLSPLSLLFPFCQQRL